MKIVMIHVSADKKQLIAGFIGYRRAKGVKIAPGTTDPSNQVFRCISVPLDFDQLKVLIKKYEALKASLLEKNDESHRLGNYALLENFLLQQTYSADVSRIQFINNMNVG